MRIDSFKLVLDGCSRLDDEAIEELCARCSSIQKLSLNGCYSLSNESLALLSRHMKSLQTLNLSGDQFEKIDEEGLLSLEEITTLQDLRFGTHIHVQKCDGYSESSTILFYLTPSSRAFLRSYANLRRYQFLILALTFLLMTSL